MSNLYADVIVDISAGALDRSFQYKIPEELSETIKEGSKVRVPFGKGNKLTDGYVIGLGCEPKCDESIIKYIEECPDSFISAMERLIRLAAWIRQTYGSTFIQALKTVLPVKEKRKRKKKSVDNEGSGSVLNEIPKLTESQCVVYESIVSEIKGQGRPCLIRGVTGSGKTHIYMKLIADAFADGKQAILLIPEISLTWQTLSRFYSCFGDAVGVLNSRLSKGERADLVENISSGVVRLVIGPRSALFAPFENLGLIIIDEEHDVSYQSEKTPRYHARETAKARADLEDASLVMGSATPSLEARYRCETGEYALFELDSRFAGAAMPDTEIVDMRLEGVRKTILSARLCEEIGKRLDAREQVMLFLNKRGHTGYYICRSCGHVIKCPHCDVALTYHTNGLLMCHYCGYNHPMVKNCPKCGSPYIGGYKIGTQQAEQSVKKLFPAARVMRMDADTTSKKDGHEKLLRAFADGEADILIGTQMIVKGHDFPNVTLVGILAADSSLYASDFRAGERTYQLLAQAIGRCGRGSKGGLGLIQTYDPDNYVIQSAANVDYEAFYAQEIASRKAFAYPPAGCIMSAHGLYKDEERLMNAMEHIRSFIEKLKVPQLCVMGPANEAVSKVRDTYRIALYVKGVPIAEAIKVRRLTERYIEINSGFNGMNIQFALND